MELLKEFLNTSTIHGLSWISNTRRHTRLFWIFVVAAGFSGAIFLIKIFLKISPQNLQLGKLVLYSFWYGTLSISNLCYYYDLLSDEGSIKLLKYITDIELFM